MLKRERNRVGGEECVVEAKHGEHAKRRAGSEVQCGGDDVRAGALGANQRARDIEAVFGKQLVEVVAGDTARDAGEFLADEGSVAVADMCQARVDLTDAAASTDERVEALGRVGSDRHAGAVVENDVERLDIVNDLATEQAMHAATVVADHAAEGAAGVCRGIGRVSKLMELCGVAQAVKDDTRLNTREALRAV